jgi:hypothetical protein
MDLDGIFALVLFVLHWRVAVCLVGSVSLAVILVNALPWFTGLQGIVIAAIGIIPGAVWEAQETSPQSAKVAKLSETTAFVAGASSVILGAVWGIFSSTSGHSFYAGAVILGLAAWGWSRYAGGLKPPVSRERIRMCTILAALVYPVAALAAHNVL